MGIFVVFIGLSIVYRVMKYSKFRDCVMYAVLVFGVLTWFLWHGRCGFKEGKMLVKEFKIKSEPVGVGKGSIPVLMLVTMNVVCDEETARRFVKAMSDVIQSDGKL